MSEFLPLLNSVSIVTTWTAVAVLVITRRLIWYKDHLRELARAEKRADRWEGVALQLLGVSEKLTVSAEVVSAVLAKLPDPGADDETGDRS